MVVNTTTAPVLNPSTTETPEAVIKKLTSADLVSIGFDDLKVHVKTAIRLFEKIDTAKKGERDNRKQSAKYVAELRRRYVAAKEAAEPTIPSDWTFPVYSEKVVGVKIPGRLLSLAALFNSLVLINGADGKPLISESVYDGAALDWLEKANAIVNSAIKKDHENWKSSKDVQDCIAALNATGDAAEKLDAIRKRQKNGEAKADNDNAVPMTPEMAIGFLLSFIRDRAKLVATKPENAKEIFCLQTKLVAEISHAYDACDLVADAFGDNYSEETLESWLKADAGGVAPHVEMISTHPNTQPQTTIAPAPQNADSSPETKDGTAKVQEPVAA